jgi:hypothetical protein
MQQHQLRRFAYLLMALGSFMIVIALSVSIRIVRRTESSGQLPPRWHGLDSEIPLVCLLFWPGRTYPEELAQVKRGSRKPSYFNSKPIVVVEGLAEGSKPHPYNCGAQTRVYKLVPSAHALVLRLGNPYGGALVTAFAPWLPLRWRFCTDTPDEKEAATRLG